jgi:glycosyltransferase involved in cell wall biosynthesis
VLNSLARQSAVSFEVVVADDGSTPETAALVKGLIPAFPVPLRHVWQEDKGFRAAAVRNLAVSKSRGDYLLFIDGDCAVLSGFIASHICLAEHGWFVSGNRILLSQSFTSLVLAQSIPFFTWPLWKFFKARLNGAVNRILPLFSLSDGKFRKLIPYKWQGAKTCNLGIWRDDFYRVNGCNESFIGWGYEDSELVIRLINAGIRRKDGRFSTPVLHMWHTEQKRDFAEANMRILLHHIDIKKTWAEVGIDGY